MTDTRAIWSIAIPAMATNVATALIGIADIWVIGQLGEAAAQGAVEIGARLVLSLLVIFNFLKTATTGLTAQAVGQKNETERLGALIRAATIALAIGLVLLIAKPLIVPLGLDFLEAQGSVRASAENYVDIRWWAAPFWLLSAALMGWLIGLRRLKTVLVVEVTVNLVNVGLAILLVLYLDYGVEGAAISSLISEILRSLMLLVALLPSARPGALFSTAARVELWKPTPMLALFRVNRDLFLRTLILTLAMMLVTRQGAQQGTVILAANAIIFQLFMFSALVLDGFENAAQVLGGEHVGAKDRKAFDDANRVMLVRGAATAILLAAVFAMAGGPIVSSFSTDPSVVEAARIFAPWLIVIPIAGVVSFIFDGIFVGATWTRAMLGTMAAAFGLYVVLLWLTTPLGNHGLWLSFTLFLAARAIGQWLLVPRLADRTFARQRAD